MKEIILRIDYLLDRNLGWFFTNGRKIDGWEERVEIKKKQLEKIKDGKKRKN
jgi:hypothetical protein